MAEIKITDHGPLAVSGGVALVDAEGNRYEAKDQYYLCRCGASNNKPFCDGSHSKVHFESAPRAGA